jgi:transcriptional regulator with XRE-family HTH domain
VNGEEIKSILGKNIRNLRAQRRYSQAVLAEIADISIIYLSNIERGVKYPKPAILAQIAEGLDVEVYELFKINHVPNATPKNDKKIINRLSKEMAKKVMQTMDGVFKHYLE